MGQKLTTEEKEMKKEWDKLHNKSQLYVQMANDLSIRKRMSLDEGISEENVQKHCFQKVVEYDEGSMSFPDWYKYKTGEELFHIRKNKK